MRTTTISLCLVLFGSVGALAQKKAVPPPPKPADSGPSLEVTMKFIQDKLNEQGPVGYVSTRTDMYAIFREFYLISGVVADAATCSLHKVETSDTKIEPNQGYDYNEGGKPVKGDDLSRRTVETSTILFKNIESIRVESMQDSLNRNAAENAHPEITFTVTPAVYDLTMLASKPVFTFHVNFTMGKQQPVVRDEPSKDDTLRFRDEETANRVAKAIVHAVELCGGGNKEPF